MRPQIIAEVGPGLMALHRMATRREIIIIDLQMDIHHRRESPLLMAHRIAVLLGERTACHQSHRLPRDSLAGMAKALVKVMIAGQDYRSPGKHEVRIWDRTTNPTPTYRITDPTETLQDPAMRLADMMNEHNVTIVVHTVSGETTTIESMAGDEVGALIGGKDLVIGTAIPTGDVLDDGGMVSCIVLCKCGIIPLNAIPLSKMRERMHTTRSSWAADSIG